jgi:hypothetical protein
MKKGASKDIPVIKRAVPQSWGTSNGTFVTDKVGNIEIAFVDYSSSKKVHLAPDIVEYKSGLDTPMYDLIIGKNTVHDLGVALDFNQSSIQIDKILLPMRDFANLKLKLSITRALQNNSNHAQESVSTRSTTKRVVKILDAKYDKADIPATVRENCSHLSMLLRFESLFNCTLGDWNLPSVSFEVKQDMKPYHGRPYPILQIHKAVLMKEINQLCKKGVLKWQPLSRWASPTFIIPKKDGTVHTISDFRKLSKQQFGNCIRFQKSVRHCRS